MYQFMLRELGWRLALALGALALLFLVGQCAAGESKLTPHADAVREGWTMVEIPTYNPEEWEPPITEIVTPATITEQAVRGEQVEVTQVEVGLPPVPSQAGLHGLPFAPDDLTGCSEMMWYAYQFGLPARFEGVGFRESSCRNDVNTYCCYGYWQLYVSLHLRDHRLAPMYAECNITSIEDIFGNEPIKKQRQACGAAAVYQVQGGSAWDAW